MADKFRTLLSLLGVCTGIFAIVAIFTLVDSIHSTISESFENYGTDILFVESQPLEPDLNEDGFFRWWKYISRPAVSWNEYKFIEQNYPYDVGMAFTARAGDDAVGVAGQWRIVMQEPLREGRLPGSGELENGAAVVVLGSKAASELFPHGEEPLGRSVKVAGGIFRVIGILEESGSNMVSTIPADDARIVPLKALERLVDLSKARTSIAVAGGDAQEVRTLMRQVRRLRPSEEDNFAINRLSFILDEMSEIFDMIGTLGWIVGIFSLLVGGFGIANIMFVSVQERTPQIGIQKALGARRRTIAAEYLREAAVLSVAGGAGGIALVWLGTLAVPSSAITLRLTAANAATGLAVSAVIGLAAGLAPALRAARLDPVEAINKR